MAKQEGDDMSWESVDGKSSKKDTNILDIAPNTTKLIHVLLQDTEEPVSYWTHYIPSRITSGPKGAVVICPGRDVCPACKEGAYRTKRVHAINVWDYENKAVKILEGGNSIFQPLKQIKDQIGTLLTVDISIKKMGSGKETQYSVIPIPMMSPFNVNMAAHSLFPVESLRTPHTVEDIQRIIDSMKGEANTVTSAPKPTNIESNIDVTTNVVDSNQEILLQFGKYKGRTVEDIYNEDPNYVKWCAENISDPKIKAEAKRVVDQRKIVSGHSSVVSEDTLKKLLINDVDDILQNDTRYKGNFALIMERMKEATISSTFPNGKSILSEYTTTELQKLIDILK